MKRIWFIFLFFVFVFACLCLISCTCDKVSVDVPTAHCEDMFCYGEGYDVTLDGCHLDNSCVDCYWFPGATGCYGNDFTNADYFTGCLPASCVVCGFDCTLLECYSPQKGYGTDCDDRPVTLAASGLDYTIDKITIVTENHVQEFENGKITIEDIELFIKLLNLQEAVTLEFFVEYTALKELQSVSFECEFQYGAAGEVFKSFDEGVYVKRGNVPSYYGEQNWKSSNIMPGKHILSATIELDAYELIALDNILPWKFVAYTYGGE